MDVSRLRSVLVGSGKLAVAVASVPSWLMAAFFLQWFWPGAKLGQTCDRVHQPWCRPGIGMPQYVTVAVLVGLASVLLLTAALHALTSRGPRGSWFAACICALVGGAAVTVVPALLQPYAPQWWFAA
jgi:hypothetical protein